MAKAKACWVATEVEKGWRLKLCVGPVDYPIRGLVCNDAESVERITGGTLGVVWVHQKKGKKW